MLLRCRARARLLTRVSGAKPPQQRARSKGAIPPQLIHDNRRIEVWFEHYMCACRVGFAHVGPFPRASAEAKPAYPLEGTTPQTKAIKYKVVEHCRGPERAGRT